MRTIRVLIALSVLLFLGVANALAFSNTYLGDDAEFHSLSSGIPSVGANTFISPTTNSWYADDSPAANINRFGDRLLIGDAATNFPATSTCGTGDWFSNFQNTLTPNGPCAYSAAFEQIVETKTNNASSGSAILGAAQSLDYNCSGCGVIGLMGFALNNKSSGGNGAFAAYLECDQTHSNGGGGCFGLEIDDGNFVNNALAGQPDPFQQTLVNDLQLACGSGITSPATFECGAALQIQPNTQTFNTGIIFGNGSITSGAAANSLTGAIEMPVGYSIIWYSAASTAKGSITIDSSGNVLLAGTGSLKYNGTTITVP